MSVTPTDDVRDEPGSNRFVLERGGATAELVYDTEPARLVLLHTEVPDSLAGHGIGGRLVRAAVKRARAEQLVVVPWCAFARQWLLDHADAAAGVRIDWTTPPPSS